MKLSDLHSLLDAVLKDKVFYGTNVYDNEQNANMPFIVYQEVSKSALTFGDDLPIYYKTNIQITLVTRKKDIKLETKLEQALIEKGLVFSLLNESKNEDKSVNRIYEIYMEEIKNGK